MKRFRLVSLAVVALLAVSLVGTATAAKKPPKKKVGPVTMKFVGAYTGTGAVKGEGANATVSASLNGTGTTIGKGTLNGQGTGNTDAKPCPVFSGTATITGSGADKINLTLSNSQACAASEDDTNNVTLKGTATVAGGAGKFAKAKGTLSFSGKFDRGAGTVQTAWTGTITY